MTVVFLFRICWGFLKAESFLPPHFQKLSNLTFMDPPLVDFYNFVVKNLDMIVICFDKRLEKNANESIMIFKIKISHWHPVYQKHPLVAIKFSLRKIAQPRSGLLSQKSTLEQLKITSKQPWKKPKFHP